MNTHEQLGKFYFDGIKTSVERGLAKYVGVASKTRPVHTLSLKTRTNCELRTLRGCVYSLPTSADPSEFFLERRVANYCPFPTSAEKPASVTLEQWFCNFLRCHAFGFPKLFRFVGSSVEVLDLDELLDFDYTHQTNHILKRKCATDCMP